MNHPGIVFSTASCVAQQSCLCSENHQKKFKKFHALPTCPPRHLACSPRQPGSAAPYSTASGPTVARRQVGTFRRSSLSPESLTSLFLGGGPEVVHVPQQKLRHAAVRQNDARNAHPVTKHCRQPGGGIGNQTGRSERIENDKTQGTPMLPGTR